MADVDKTKVTKLAEALEQPESRTAATEALRGLVEQLTLVLDGDQLRIELQGNLAAMLGAATNAKRSPEMATSCCKYRSLRGLAALLPTTLYIVAA
jgi:site-specific DNA recombinase